MATENQRDLILGEGQYAYIQDQTKGHIGVYCGPHKTSLAGTDLPVRFVPETNRFERCTLEEAIQEFVLVREGSYVIQTNPAKESGLRHPTTGSSNRTPLEVGRKVIIPGPTSFALWPGQHAQVVEGHRLRSNQYLVARVYNDEAARTNWTNSVLRPATEQKPTDPPASEKAEPAKADPSPAREFIMGQKFIIKGTEASFFIPPTGIEVEPDENGRYVREAVTLERLEYCLLLSENGVKRYVRGPNVVFPEPNEIFVTKDGTRKFRAIELNNDMGIHIKVIADYEEEGRHYAAGEELFLTGREQRIYYPREEHAVIKYGNRDIVFGVVIPKGDARYVLRKEEGDIALVEGPRIFLPDPRREVIVKRVLTPQQVADWFPGNQSAAAYNERLRRDSEEGGRGYVAAAPQKVASAAESIQSRGAGDAFDRGSEYTPPRTITIDPRFDGAVQIGPWIGYAVLVLSKSGNRRVVMGPDTVSLGFDESLQVLTLSTGKPKTTDALYRTAYLAVSNNHVSDIVHVVTRDMVRAELKLSYRVNFVGENAEDRLKWFSVPNYVKHLCDHLRSLLRGACKQIGIEELSAAAARIVRDTILGIAPEGGKRSGRLFEENGMHVHDVEILDVVIGDTEISRTLVTAQHQAVASTLAINAEEQALELDRRRGRIARERLQVRDETSKTQVELQRAQVMRELEAELERIAGEIKAALERQKLEVEADEHRSRLHASDLERMAARNAVDDAAATKRLEKDIARIVADAEAHVKRFGAVSPQFIAALESFGQSMLAVEASKALGPLTLLGGESVSDVLLRIFRGTKLEGAIDVLRGNGSGAKPLPAAAPATRG